MQNSRFTPLLVALVLSFVPFSMLGYGLLDTLFKIGLLLGGAYTIAHSRRHIGVLIAFVSPVVIIQFAPEFFVGTLPQILAALSGLVFLIYVAVLTVSGILRAKSINRDVLMGGVAGYLLLGNVWSLAYMLVLVFEPNSFTFNPSEDEHLFSTMRYFSFVTLTSLGYGDISPVGVIARQLAILEAVSGQIYLTVFIGRLLGFSVVPVANAS